MSEKAEIVCCGEAIMDMLPRQLEDGSPVFLPVEGGAIYNTAIALGRLDEPTAYFGGMSTDLFGCQLIDYLKGSDVITDYLNPVSNPSTLAFVKLTNGHAEYSFMDENSAGQTLSVDKIPNFNADIKALHFGGISLIGEPCGSTYETIMQQHHDTKVISLDPNIRTSFIHDETSYRDRLNRLVAMTDIIKVSDEDLEWLYPNTAFEDVAKAWIEAGVSIAILTMGADGSRAITKNHDVTVVANVKEVVDTVGAGDCFNAGMLSSLNSADVLNKTDVENIEESQLITALEFASLVAGYVVGQAGAKPPFRYELL